MGVRHWGPAASQVSARLGAEGEAEACGNAVEVRGLDLVFVDTLCPLKPPAQN